MSTGRVTVPADNMPYEAMKDTITKWKSYGYKMVGDIMEDSIKWYGL